MKKALTKEQVQRQVRLLFARKEKNLPVINASEQKWRDMMDKENDRLRVKYLGA